MAMKKALVSAAVATGMAASGILVASPAHAAKTWGYRWPSEIECQYETDKKRHDYNKRGYRVTVDERCGYYKIGDNPPYWYSQLTYSPR